MTWRHIASTLSLLADELVDMGGYVVSADAGREVAILAFKLQRCDGSGTAHGDKTRTGWLGAWCCSRASRCTGNELPLRKIELPLGIKVLILLSAGRRRRLRTAGTSSVGRISRARVLRGEVGRVEAWQRRQPERRGAGA